MRFKGRNVTSEAVTSLCEVCGIKPAEEPYSFIALRGGGLFPDMADHEVLGPSRFAEGFLEVYWYGDSRADSAPRVPASALHRVVSGASDGQFEVRVCSRSCLRKYFAAVLRGLSAQIELAKKARRKAPRRPGKHFESIS